MHKAPATSKPGACDYWGSILLRTRRHIEKGIAEATTADKPLPAVPAASLSDDAFGKAAKESPSALTPAYTWETGMKFMATGFGLPQY